MSDQPDLKGDFAELRQSRRDQLARKPSKPVQPPPDESAGQRVVRLIVQMVAAGERGPVALVVVTKGPVIGTPCGTCRQTLAEFAEDLPVKLMVDGDGVPARMTSLAALLPDAFRASVLRA